MSVSDNWPYWEAEAIGKRCWGAHRSRGGDGNFFSQGSAVFLGGLVLVPVLMKVSLISR